MAGPHQDAGLKMYLHNQSEIPLVRDLGFALAPGLHSLVGTNVVVVSTCKRSTPNCPFTSWECFCSLNSIKISLNDPRQVDLMFNNDNSSDNDN